MGKRSRKKASAASASSSAAPSPAPAAASEPTLNPPPNLLTAASSTPDAPTTSASLLASTAAPPPATADPAAASAIASRVVFPGDSVQIPSGLKQKKPHVLLGQGLVATARGTAVVASKFGVLAPSRYSKRFAVRTRQRRYVPVLEDLVLGIVTERYGTHYSVDIKAPFPAILQALSFDGATKRNKPNLAVGALVFCRVVQANKFMQPEVTCKSVGQQGKEWMTGEAMFGELKAGTVVDVSLSMAATLLHDRKHVVLTTLSRSIKFEVAVGLNGRLWIRAAKPREVVLIANALRMSEQLPPRAAKRLVKELVGSQAGINDLEA